MTPEELFEKYTKDIANQGIYLNPDKDFTIELIRGILVNRERYGEDYCPCRLVSEIEEIDRQIICPCIFRDSDIDQYGQCYCALFVNQEWIDSGMERQIPDQWQPDEFQEEADSVNTVAEKDEKNDTCQQISLQTHQMWYCTVCGYIAYRNTPPQVCPICKAKKDRFKILNLLSLENNS